MRGSQSWPFFDPGREQVDYLSGARRADVRPTSGRVNPAEVGLVEELCQSAKECARGRGSRQAVAMSSARAPRCGPFRFQFNGHVAERLRRA